PPVVTSVPDESPRYRTLLSQNAPNPFNPSTTISFETGREERVRLSVYDVRGRLVRTLVDGRLSAGPHAVVWDGRDDAGDAVASGIYIYQMKSGAPTRARRMTLLK